MHLLTSLKLESQNWNSPKKVDINAERLVSAQTCGDFRPKKAGFLSFTASGRKLFLFGAKGAKL